MPFTNHVLGVTPPAGSLLTDPSLLGIRLSELRNDNETASIQQSLGSIWRWLYLLPPEMTHLIWERAILTALGY